MAPNSTTWAPAGEAFFADRYVQRVAFRAAVPANLPPRFAQWDFGDGTTAEGPAPEHIYLTSGDFKARLRLQYYGEVYERTSTVVLNSYVHPIAWAYLDNLEGDLTGMGMDSHTLHVMQSNGGSATFGAAQAAPINLVESGPVDFDVVDFHEDSLGKEPPGEAIAYLQIELPDGVRKFGVGIDRKPSFASIKALASFVRGRRKE